MQHIQLGSSDIQSSRLVYGCMRICGDNSEASREKGKEAIRTALEAGYTHFDHADIYASGNSESLFAEVLAEDASIRDQIIITSKCGIRRADAPNKGDPGRYDFRDAYISDSVDGILSRLNIDCLDILLLHRPDYLMNANEVAACFQRLKESGKVKQFGVSNFSPSQFSLLQSACDVPLIMNQVEINIHNIDALLDGTLDQCQERGVTPQAWCPIGGVVYPAWGNTFSAEDEARIAEEFKRQSEQYGVEDWIIMLAWLLKHPAQICPIIGSTTAARIQAALKSLDIEYTREDWYRLLQARNGHAVP